MTPEQINMAIAEACGWKVPPFVRTKTGGSSSTPDYGQHPKTGNWEDLPNYHGDLNAMHEAESYLDIPWSERSDYHGWDDYWEQLETITGSRTFDKDITTDCRSMIHATAAQRAEAFLRTIGKWKD